MPIPLAYFITFTCYGTRLHGDEAGSVDRSHNVHGSPFLPPKLSWVQADEKEMQEPRYELDSNRRGVVLESMQEVCDHRSWILLAAHVRSTHAHMVVSAAAAPERILNDIKAYASRALNRRGFDHGRRKRWTHHGSTRYLWKPEHIGAAINYVVREQGEPMAVWEKFPPPSAP